MDAEDDERGEAEVAPDGTDLTLIRWFLTLSPTERVHYLEDTIGGILALRESNP